MPSSIEDYALLGDTHGVARRPRRLPRLALPAAVRIPRVLLGATGNEENGRWQIGLYDANQTARRYRRDSLVLETDFETAAGSIRLVDFMPPRAQAPTLVRIVEGLRGRVRVQMDLRPRFDYGHIRPRIRSLDGSLVATADQTASGRASRSCTRVSLGVVRADFEIVAGERAPFVLSWHPSHEPAGQAIDPFRHSPTPSRTGSTGWLGARTGESGGTPSLGRC